MFNLEKAVADWRRQMTAGGMSSREVLDELEDHLREEIERQVRGGASEKFAFRTAAARIGRAGVVGTEFAKLNRESRPGFVRFSILIFVGCVLVISLWTFLEYVLSSWERITGICAVSLICGYLVVLPYWLKVASDAALVRFAQVLKVASSFLWVWPLWAVLEALKVVHSGMGIVATTALWCLYAAIALSAFAFGCSRRSRPAGDAGRASPPAGPRPAATPSGPTPVPWPSSTPLDDCVQQSFAAACAEAKQWGHDFIGTEHVLLGLLQSPTGAFAGFLQQMGLHVAVVRAEIEQIVAPGVETGAAGGLVLTPRASRAIAFAARESAAVNRRGVGAEYLFLGLLRERRGVAGVVLKKLGVRPRRVRKLLSEQRP